MNRTKPVVYFESDPDKIKSSGDNSGYIYNPNHCSTKVNPSLFSRGKRSCLSPANLIIWGPGSNAASPLKKQSFYNAKKKTLWLL